MKAHTELREMARRVGDLGRFADEDEAERHFLSVCGDISVDDLPRLNAIFEQEAAEAQARSDAVGAAIGSYDGY